MRTIEQLKKEYASLSQDQMINLVFQLKQEVDQLKEQLFSKKSEKRIDEEKAVMRPLFNEAENIINEQNSEEEDKKTVVPEHTRKKRGKRSPLPPSLPRVRVEHDLSAEEKICSIHKSEMKRIGEKISEKLDIIPAKIQVIQDVTFSYTCKECSHKDDKSKILSSKPDPSPIPKSIASAGLLAFIAVSKYQDSLPLYRQESIFKRYNININRSSLARWMIKCSELSQNILNCMTEDLLNRKGIGCDETRVQVLDEPNRTSHQNSYMWVACSHQGKPIVIFRYDIGRSAFSAKKFLQGYKGIVVCDGLKSYDSLAKSSLITLAGCLAHIRRYFFKAEKAHKKADPKTVPKASKILDLIKKLYKVEGDIKNKTDEEILKSRQELSKPIIQEIKNWLDLERDRVLPKSLLGKAIHYALGQWDKMEIFLSHPFIEIDNNRCERHIRNFAIGRKNWLFSQCPDGATASANLYSLIESAKANNIDPYDYLSLIFKELPKITKMEKVYRLTPHNIREFYTLKSYNK